MTPATNARDQMVAIQKTLIATRPVSFRFWTGQRLAGEKLLDQPGDLIRLFIECKMTGIKDVNFRPGQITPVRFGFSDKKRRIIFAPDHQGWWLALLQPGLP